MKIKGTIIQEFEVEDFDILMSAYSLWKKSIGKEDYSLLNTTWKKSDDICSLNDIKATQNEIVVAFAFDRMFNESRNS